LSRVCGGDSKNIVVIDNRKISEFCLKPGAKHADEFFSVGYTNSISDQKRLRRNLLGKYDLSKIEISEVLPEGGQPYTIFMMLCVGRKKERLELFGE
jgi:hypothetical protein